MSHPLPVPSGKSPKHSEIPIRQSGQQSLPHHLSSLPRSSLRSTLATSPNAALSMHLISRSFSETAAPEVIGSFTGVHSLSGGAVTRDVYTAHERQSASSIASRRHSIDSSLLQPLPPDPEAPVASDLLLPGAFRRQYMRQRAARRGDAEPTFLAQNFLDFLVLYGTFGGDISTDGSDTPSEASSDDIQDMHVEPSERTPLLARSLSESTLVKGTSPSKAFFMIMKAFIGTGVLFLPRAFANGGLLLGCTLLSAMGGLTLYCMLLLVETSRANGDQSFGDLAARFYGPGMRGLVLASIAVSQVGFSCAYYIFIGKSLADLVAVYSDNTIHLPDWVYILIQGVVYTPLCWIRRIEYFSITSLIGDVFILAGLGYILAADFVRIATHGVSPTAVVLGHTRALPLLIGTVMFAFEGICLILPIAASMGTRVDRFAGTLKTAVAATCGIFCLVGGASYLAFGDDVEILIFRNMQPGPLLSFLQALYVCAVMLTFPLALYPVVRITEAKMFPHHQHHHHGRHQHGETEGTLHHDRTGWYSRTMGYWGKNMYRTLLVGGLGVVSWTGSERLERIVALIGCLCCIPLSLVYPAMLHLCMEGISRRRVALDVGIIVFGAVATVVTTGITLEGFRHPAGS
ncbi:MAG: hypothetical protein SGCHY_000963 [Lobulomycetales sp.]